MILVIVVNVSVLAPCCAWACRMWVPWYRVIRLLQCLLPKEPHSVAAQALAAVLHEGCAAPCALAQKKLSPWASSGPSALLLSYWCDPGLSSRCCEHARLQSSCARQLLLSGDAVTPLLSCLQIKALVNCAVAGVKAFTATNYTGEVEASQGLQEWASTGNSIWHSTLSGGLK